MRNLNFGGCVVNRNDTSWYGRYRRCRGDAPQGVRRRRARAVFCKRLCGDDDVVDRQQGRRVEKRRCGPIFPSKEDLFAAVVDGIVEQYGDALTIELPLDEPVPDVLRRFGMVLMTEADRGAAAVALSPVVGEADRFPHLAETFYDRGPRRGKARAAAWVAEKMVRGEIRMGDPMRAVQQFSGLCQSGLYQFAVLNLPESRDLGRVARGSRGRGRRFLSGLEAGSRGISPFEED